ncbi:MAG TPA: hypothetical protein VMA71_03245 [Alloacidobacterium sp.]|nr:hypothetical protein [Alloacidobacterium sp.]
MNAPNRTLKQRAYHGLKHYLLLTFYLWLVFALLILYKSVILSEHHIPFAANGFALINALALAKVMMVAREFHLGDWFKEAPLIYPTLLKSAIFAALLGCFKMLEEALVGLYHGKTFSESLAGLGGGTVEGILSLMAILAVALIPFFGFSELRRVVGEGKLEKLFFGSHHPVGSSS